MLDAALEAEDCDHTLRRTEAWVKEHGLVLATVLDGVREFGGFCDCEVLANVVPYKFGYAE